jgi:NAD(P)-dependent dehydrogenase (short-subunit alcohol dehydrogenase family)
MLLDGTVAIVCGVGPGIGREAALALAREGADVALAARTEEKLAKVAAEVTALGRRAVSVPTDVAVAGDRERLVEQAVKELGRLDVLVNNAFVQPPLKPTEDIAEEDWRRAFDVNMLGSIGMAKAVLPAMRSAGGGSIVFVNTMSSRTAGYGMGPYAATKAGMLVAARVLAREVGPDGIRVNSVVPGYVWGPNLRWWFKSLAAERGVTPEEIEKEVAAGMALRRIPTSEEVANAILFLASDLASGITGESLDVNGGRWFE